jgi:hypothetical protein
MSNGRQPKSCLGRVFNFRVVSFASQQIKCMLHMRALLELKILVKFVVGFSSSSIKSLENGPIPLTLQSPLLNVNFELKERPGPNIIKLFARNI